MDPQSLSQIALWSGAELVSGDPVQLVTGVSHDTRSIKKGDLYIALRGENFDGNKFLLEAAQKGAVAAICDRKISEDCSEAVLHSKTSDNSQLTTEKCFVDASTKVELPATFGILPAADPLQALTALACSWRQQLSLRSIVLTGSSGKTTTKDFTAAVLQSFFQTTWTQGNLNNHIGVPLSILKASSSDQIAVWEIGMNHRGEIAPLAALTQPDIAIITNIGTAHIGFLGSREAIAEEKGDLLAALPKTGVAILPAADAFCEVLAKRTKARIVRVGIDVGELQATALEPNATGTHFQICYQGKSYPAFLPVVGRHMVSNALLALAAGLECGVALEVGIEALQKIQPSKSRLFVQECHGITLVDDSYNANPDSMEAALHTIDCFRNSTDASNWGVARALDASSIDTFSISASSTPSTSSASASLEASLVNTVPCAGRRIGVLGRMGELGDYEKEGYERVGRVAAKRLDILITVGSETAPLAEAARQEGLMAIHQVKNNSAAVDLLLSLAHPGDLILVKGSLSARLKEVVDKIKN